MDPKLVCYREQTIYVAVANELDQQAQPLQEWIQNAIKVH